MWAKLEWVCAGLISQSLYSCCQGSLKAVDLIVFSATLVSLVVKFLMGRENLEEEEEEEPEAEQTVEYEHIHRQRRTHRRVYSLRPRGPRDKALPKDKID